MEIVHNNIERKRGKYEIITNSKSYTYNRQGGMMQWTYNKKDR